MRRECRERFPRHRLQRKQLVSDLGMHRGTCVTLVPRCMSGSQIRGGRENVPGACATHNSTYLEWGPCPSISTVKYVFLFLQIAAHRVVLAARSHYFDALFQPSMREGSQSVIELKELMPEYVRLLINYMYSGRITITDDNVEVIGGCRAHLKKYAHDSCFVVFS